MPDISYTRVNWANYPSTSTKISAANLNNMDLGIKNIFDMTYSSFYNTKAAADADISNIPSGAFVYTDDSTDVLTATQVKYDDGTAGGTSVQAEVAQLNADLSVFSFRVNSGVPEFSIDGGTTWNKLGGGTMKCAKYGVVNIANPNQTGGGTATIDITDLNLTSAEDYYVVLNGICPIGGGGGFAGFYVSAKTATSFTITLRSIFADTLPCAYQVITMV